MRASAILATHEFELVRLPYTVFDEKLVELAQLTNFAVFRRFYFNLNWRKCPISQDPSFQPKIFHIPSLFFYFLPQIKTWLPDFSHFTIFKQEKLKNFVFPRPHANQTLGNKTSQPPGWGWGKKQNLWPE